MTKAAIAKVAMKFFDAAVEACCDPAPLLEVTEHAFDDFALPADFTVMLDCQLAVGPGRDDRRGAALI